MTTRFSKAGLRHLGSPDTRRTDTAPRPDGVLVRHPSQQTEWRVQSPSFLKNPLGPKYRYKAAPP